MAGAMAEASNVPAASTFNKALARRAATSSLRRYSRWSANCMTEAGSLTSAGIWTTPWEAVIEKLGLCSHKAATRGVHKALVGLRRDIEQHAELVSTHAVGGSVWRDHVLQALAQAHQKSVARRVAEGVIEELEAVEVVQHQFPRLARARPSCMQVANRSSTGAGCPSPSKDR